MPVQEVPPAPQPEGGHSSEGEPTPLLAPDGKPRPQLNPEWKDLQPTARFLILDVPERFCVVLDDDYDVDWATETEYDEELKQAKIATGKIEARVEELQAYPLQDLPEELRLSFRRMVGQGMARALDKELLAADAILKKAEAFIVARSHERARCWYVFGSSVGTGACFVLTLTVAAVYWCARQEPVAGRFNIMAVGLGGAAGALFSILLRVGRAPLDPAAGFWTHFIEGAARIGVGVIGAAIILAAVRVRILFPQLSSGYGLVLLCLVAGASERLASDLIERVSAAKSDADFTRKPVSNNGSRGKSAAGGQ